MSDCLRLMRECLAFTHYGLWILLGYLGVTHSDFSLLPIVSIGLRRAVRAMMTWPAQVLPGGRLLASADEIGNVAVADLRMLGSARQPLLWQVPSLSCLWSHRTGTPAHKRCRCVVMGASLPLAFASWMPQSVAAARERM